MFETFEKGATKAPVWPEVTLLRKGSLHLNATARKLLGDADFVDLLFDQDRQIIGLRASRADSPNAYKLSPVRDVFWTVSLIAFLKFYEIEVTESRRRIPTLEKDVLCINLLEPGVIVDRKTA
jgi:hypothetical protein